MGSRIAAHFANAGIPSVLLDVSGCISRRRASRPRPSSGPADFFVDSSASMIATGSFDDDLAKVAECDWIIEAVTENLEIKRDPVEKGGGSAQAGRDRLHQHQRHPSAPDCRGIFARLPQAFSGHALLQSAALPAPARSDSRRRTPIRSRRIRFQLRRSPPGQRRGAVQGHAELHRQPHRQLFRRNRRQNHSRRRLHAWKKWTRSPAR